MSWIMKPARKSVMEKADARERGEDEEKEKEKWKSGLELKTNERE